MNVLMLTLSCSCHTRHHRRRGRCTHRRSLGRRCFVVVVVAVVVVDFLVLLEFVNVDVVIDVDVGAVVFFLVFDVCFVVGIS